MKDKKEYAQFKSDMLENSLHSLTFEFINKLSMQKISCLDEIKELDALIVRESQSMENEQIYSVSIVEEKGVKSQLKSTRTK